MAVSFCQNKGLGERVVLVTGAAGGLGQGLCREFSDQGWRVAAGYHRTKPDACLERVQLVELDVTRAGHAERAVGEIAERWGRLDVLVNNAGCVNDRLFWQIKPEEWEQVLRVNLTGAFLCARAAWGPMRNQRDGHILNISSWSGLSGQRGQAHYAAAKAGLLGMTKALAREMASSQVRVNAILPGVMPTPMTAAMKPEQLAQRTSDNLLGRLNSVAEVARFTVFLAGMDNVSGQVFQLDSRVAPWT